MTYWDKQAESDIPANVVTLRDQNQRELEIDFILKWLYPKDFAVEVGCGNGYSTRTFAKHVDCMIAIDSSDPMIYRAAMENEDVGNAVFMLGDVRNTTLEEEIADVVISQRCLINLPTWKEQTEAIDEIYRILKPGGMFVLVEGLKLNKLNALRIKAGLPKIEVVPHNNNFDLRNLIWYLMKNFDIREIRTFGLYDFITRVIHPMMVYPNEPSYDAAINTIAKKVELELVGDPDFLSMCGLFDFSKFSRIAGIASRKIARG